MPELPEVENVRRRLAGWLVGRHIASVEESGKHLGLDRGLTDILCGRRIEEVERRGKFLVLNLGDMSLLVHLGMSGRFILRANARRIVEKHDHLSLAMDDGSTVVFNDFRRFGRMRAITSSELSNSRELCRLGADPLQEGFDPAALAIRLTRRRSSLKVALLDQRVVAGLGNIYSCESLWAARLAPSRPISELAQTDIEVLTTAIRDVLTRAVAAGGATLDDYRGTHGQMGDFDRSFAVFARAGLPCYGCNEIVSRGRLAGRITYWCQRCQR